MMKERCFLFIATKILRDVKRYKILLLLPPPPAAAAARGTPRYAKSKYASFLAVSQWHQCSREPLGDPSARAFEMFLKVSQSVSRRAGF